MTWLATLPILAAIGTLLCLFGASQLPRDFTRATQPLRDRVTDDLLPEHPVSQEFVATSDGVDRVGVLLSTRARVNQCTIVFTLVDAQTSAEVARITVPGSSVVDARYQAFSFPLIAKSAGRSYRFSLASPDASPNHAIAIFETISGIDNEGGLTLSGVREPGSLTFETHYQSPSALASYLDELTRNKPGLWGNREFYVLLAVAYVASLAGLLGAIIRRGETVGLFFLVSLMVCQSLAYISIVPPWEVPDEPEHFVYVRQLWLDQRNEPTGTAELAVLQSMARHDWYQLNQMPPPVKEPTNLDDIPFLRLSDLKGGKQPTFYYQLAAVAVQLSRQTDVDSQLYAARLLSALLSMGIVASAYFCGRLLVSEESALTLAAIVALFPERAFVGAGVNSDNLANLLASLTFLGSVGLVARGWSVRRALGLALACALLPLAKTTAIEGVTAPLAVSVSGLLSAVARRWSRRTAVGLAVVTFGVLLVIVGLSLKRDPYGWSAAGAASNDRVQLAGPGGAFALSVRDSGHTGYGSVYQSIPGQTATRLAGHPITAGAWVRGGPNDQTGALQIFDGVNWGTSSVVATKSWKFVSVSAVLDPKATELLVDLVPTNPSTRATDPLFFSGVVVVASEESGGDPPTLVDGGRMVLWNGTAIMNLVTNGSAEVTVWDWQGPVQHILSSLGEPDPLANIQASIYAGTVERLPLTAYVDFFAIFVESFWARFGWMNIGLPSGIYVVIEAITVALLLGAVGLLVRVLVSRSSHRQTLDKVQTLSAIVVFVGFAVAIIRGIPGVGFTQGRYALPVLVPFILLLCLGSGRRDNARMEQSYSIVLVALFGILNLVCLLGAIIPTSYL